MVKTGRLLAGCDGKRVGDRKRGVVGGGPINGRKNEAPSEEPAPVNKIVYDLFSRRCTSPAVSQSVVL